ncbi:caspase family protein [Argonema antarcticum]|uniref:caspase family protein n=1 Tax=Argonema antarcticum TaxID=2942763 RepID=UPI002012BC9B|nr:caspase family protein [Argonema antarcticum]MCL1471085.1 caspase family protein [Argonema antarcticum A004/B2]
MKRRSFLQRAGWVMAALGVGEAGLVMTGNRYYRVLAQPSPRKLAMLVGINQYSGSSLTGCLTDVELQQELLIHRFGFVPSDILVLADRQATGQNIETAFIEHLSKQAKPGDAVVFHFSGYGSRVERMNEEESLIQNPKSKIQNLLVPVDGVANGVLEETLWLLLRSLDTDAVTAVLDTSYTDLGTGLWGNLRSRSQPQQPAGQPSAQELAFQAQLRLNSKLKTAIPGVVLAAAGPDRQAFEEQLNGVGTGLFTFALTQYLWQSTPATTVQVSLCRVAATIEQMVGNKQQPMLVRTTDDLALKTNPKQKSLTYHLFPNSSEADGVVTAVEEDGKAAQLWLGGLPIAILASYGVNSLLTLLPLPGSEAVGNSPRQLLIRSREGLKAKARIFPLLTGETYQLQAGQLVQESIRVLPRNVGLTVAIDSSLERIERVDATSAFSSIPNVSLVVTGEQPADCVLARVQKRGLLTGEKSSSPIYYSQYGLFLPGFYLSPNTVGAEGEAVKTAVQRLVPTLQTLLAVKLLRLSGNEGASRLGVRATLEMVDPTEQVLMQRTTVRATGPAPASDSVSADLAENAALMTDSGMISLPIGSRIQYRVHNYSDVPVYFILLGTDSSGNAIALLPPHSFANPSGLETNPLQQQAVGIGETIILPAASSPFKWVVQGPTGLNEMQLILSRKPLTQTLAALESTQHPRGDFQRLGILVSPLEVARAVLQDLHQASLPAAETVAATPDSFAFDMNAWATLSFIYQVA